jgi:fascin 1/2
VYLTALGAKGTLKATKERIGLDELFVLEDSHPQIKMVAVNKRRVSVRQGQEVSANQDDVTDAEFFQLEINTATKLVCLRVLVAVARLMMDVVVDPHAQEPVLVCG